MGVTAEQSGQELPLPLIEEAVRRLRSGEVVAFPTETVYGLGADALNAQAVREVFALKRRPTEHPLIVHCVDGQAARRWASEFPPAAGLLAARFWPGPLTLVVPAALDLPRAVTGGQDSVGLRVPAHPVARQLLKAFGGPLAAPSANRFGQVSPTSSQHVRDEFPEAGFLILNGGPCEVGIESTIVACLHGAVTLLRPGIITPEDIFGCLGLFPLHSTAAGPRVSGSLESHYAPRARVELAPADQLERHLAATKSGAKTLLLLAQKPDHPLPPLVEFRAIPDDPRELARVLYSLLREGDERGFDRLLFVQPANEGVGLAVGDRLRRASGGRNG